ncbi:LysR family transcriptional regulator [Psychromarinibacter sp. C21-152]|uniref:LysR family transcriptional regulator n=1 Tax=Psychromarinibacter sediminicola TaxID=3033385 RepID=A0AAE3NV68_9RHOB|nr:LysR family transcriptional regulator [Psychromarinibacter sediminicola]MDF0601217.1 LysR family transcriptional regulator [Psychromarinibacter sediminicola]
MDAYLMDPKHLYQFAMIVDLGSMSRAAQRLNVTQPTLSRMVRLLEDQVGSTILRRDRYGVAPTEIGERLAAEGRVIADRVLRADDAVDQWRLGLTRELRVGVGPVLAVALMGRFLEAALEPDWSTALRIEVGSVAELIRRLDRDDLDVVFAPSRINRAQARLRQEVVFEDRIALYAGATNPLAKRRGIVPNAALAGQKWIAMGAVSGLRGSTREVLELLGLEHEAVFMNFSGDATMALHLLNSTDVMCVLPRRLVELLPSRKRFGEVRVDCVLPERNVAIWTAAAKHDLPQIRRLRDRFVAFVRSDSDRSPGPAA